MVKFIAKKLGILPDVKKQVSNPTNFPYYLLRFEGFFMFLAAVIYYFVFREFSVLRLIAFFVLLVAPDVALFAYAFGQKTGAIVYDVVHTYILPLGVFALALFLQIGWLIDISLIWIVHIAQDRMRGYGFKYTDRFEGSHLHSVR